MGDRVSHIRHDYRARHHSGARSVDTIRYLVIHDGETTSTTTAAEGMGAWFANAASQGSAHYGVDNDSTQQYLPDSMIAWGAPPANQTGLHVECAGRASYARARWLDDLGPMLRRAGWLVAAKCRAYRVPLDVLDADRLRRSGLTPARGHGGLVTHSTVSKAYHQSTHTDPGSGFPMDVLLLWARHYSRPWSRRGRPILHRGSRGRAVRSCERLLARHGLEPGVVDNRYTAATESAVRRFQHAHRLRVDGVVGPTTWKALDE